MKFCHWAFWVAVVCINIVDVGSRRSWRAQSQPRIAGGRCVYPGWLQHMKLQWVWNGSSVCQGRFCFYLSVRKISLELGHYSAISLYPGGLYNHILYKGKKTLMHIWFCPVKLQIIHVWVDWRVKELLSSNPQLPDTLGSSSDIGKISERTNQTYWPHESGNSSNK